MELYKVLDEDRMPCKGGHGQWLPAGEWMPPVEGPLVACGNGYHVCRIDQLLSWLGPTVWLVEVRGDVLIEPAKCVARQAMLGRRLTWDARIARHFACDCAERALGRLETPDERSVNAIAVARRYADGQATDHELAAAWAAASYAARDAARDAARAAARDAARDAAWDAQRKHFRSLVDAAFAADDERLTTY